MPPIDEASSVRQPPGLAGTSAPRRRGATSGARSSRPRHDTVATAARDAVRSAAATTHEPPAAATADDPRTTAATPKDLDSGAARDDAARAIAKVDPRGAAHAPRPRAGGRRHAAFRDAPADEFGLDPEFRERLIPVFRLLYEKYWRVDARGVRHVPRRGPTILVANHSGALPFDATMIACALHEARHPRTPRFLYDRFVDNLPLIPTMYRRAGGVLASHANAARLLEKGELVALFPEGVAGLSKLFSARYVLQPFSSGFVRLALRHHAAIVPVAVVGAEEIYPLLGRLHAIGKLVGAPYLPLTPFFPLLGPLGMIPLPTKWMIRFGKPIVLDASARRSHDGIAVRAIAEQIRVRVQQMVRALLRRRGGVF